MTDVVVNAPKPARIPLKKRKECVACHETSRLYSQLCVACDDICLCTACELKGAASMVQTNCCNNYYCVNCADDTTTEITVVCPRCKRAGCVGCFDGRCAITDRLFCDNCLQKCTRCSEDMRLVEFSRGSTHNGRAQCNACHKEDQIEVKKRKRADAKKAATEILKQHGMTNPFNDYESDE